MAKLVKNEKKIFMDRVLDQLNKSTQDYVKFFEGKPVFVTYYSQNNDTSLDGILDDTVEYFGVESGLRFSKINNCPLFNLVGLELEEDADEFGLNTNSEGTAVCVPDVVIPKEGDRLTFSSIKEDYTFLINKVLPDKIAGKQFFQITFSLFHVDIDNTEMNVTKEFEVSYDNLGSNEYKALLSSEDHNLITRVTNLYDLLFNFVVEKFYNPYLNIISYPISNDGEGRIYDSNLTHFLIKNELLIKDDIKEALDNIYLSYIDIGKDSHISFNLKESVGKTIFDSIEYLDKIVYPTSFPEIFIPNSNRFNELSFFGDPFSIRLYSSTLNTSIAPNLSLDDNFYTKLTSNTLYMLSDTEEDMNFFSENSVIKFIHNRLDESIFLDGLEDLDVEEDYKSLILSVLLMFILKRIKNKLLKL